MEIEEARLSRTQSVPCGGIKSNAVFHQVDAAWPCGWGRWEKEKNKIFKGRKKKKIGNRGRQDLAHWTHVGELSLKRHFIKWMQHDPSPRKEKRRRR